MPWKPSSVSFTHSEIKTDSQHYVGGHHGHPPLLAPEKNICRGYCQQQFSSESVFQQNLQSTKVQQFCSEREGHWHEVLYELETKLQRSEIGGVLLHDNLAHRMAT